MNISRETNVKGRIAIENKNKKHTDISISELTNSYAYRIDWLLSEKSLS